MDLRPRALNFGHIEPPAWLYQLLARGPIARRIYRYFVDDLTPSLPAGARLLDVGTGPGYLLQLLSRKRPDVHLVGLDLDYKMIYFARRRSPPASARLTQSDEHRKQATECRIAWVVADVLALPFPGGRFDQVIATFSLHTWRDPAAGLQEIRRVLKPGGRAWIYELNRDRSGADLKKFARETGLPSLLLYPGMRILGRQHALTGKEFAALLRQTAAAGAQLQAVHHVLWRGELAV